MRAIIFVFLIYNLSVHAQNDKDTKDKPTWSENLPERVNAPELELDFQAESGNDLDMENMGIDIDRSSLFDDEVIEFGQDQGEDLNNINEDERLAEEKRQIVLEAIAVEKRQAELEVIAVEKRQTEIKVIAEEEERKKRQAEEKRQAELQTEQKRQAEIEVEKQKLAEQKLIEQAKSEDKISAANESNIEPTKQEQSGEIQAENTPEETTNSYNWKKIKNVLPIYPISAVRSKTEGWVLVRVTIDNAGNVIDTNIVNSNKNIKIFNQTALKAVRQWKFEPPSKYGIEDNQTQEVKIDFKF